MANTSRSQIENPRFHRERPPQIPTNYLGRIPRDYRDALQEFFAEMTEAYFGSNDFYPFVAGELQQAEPEIFALMAEVWGPLPQAKPRAKGGGRK